MEKFLYLLLVLYPFVCPATGCIRVGNGCLSHGLTFGGRLVFSGDIGMNFGNLPTLNGNRVFIFQTPPPHVGGTFRRPSAGRGQIWIGQTRCAGAAPGHCPSTETRPCLSGDIFDQETCRCRFVLNADEKDNLIFTWERPTCVPEGEEVTYKYNFWMDGNTETGTTTDTRKIFDTFQSGSKYFFEVNVTTASGRFVSSYISEAAPGYTNPTPLTFSGNEPDLTVSWPAWNENTDKGRGPIAEYVIQYRLKGNSNFHSIREGLSYQHQFQNLIGGATYEFRIMLVKNNPREEGDPSRIQEQVIACPVSVPTVTNLMLTNDDTCVDGFVGIIANWSVSGLSDSCYLKLNKTLTVSYDGPGATGCPAANPPTIDTIRVSDVGARSMRIPYIKPYSRYTVMITVENEAGTAMDMDTIVSAEAVPSLHPEPVSVMVSDSQITFMWDEPECEHQNGVIMSYECRYLVWQDGSTSPTEMSSTTSSTQKTFAYSPYSKYIFSVAARTSKGVGPRVEIDPPCYYDETPLIFEDVSSSYITVRWPAWDKNVDLGEGPVVDYILYYRKQGEADFTQMSKMTSLTHQVTGLTKGDVYEFQIQLVTDNPVRAEGRRSSIQQSIACQGIGDFVPYLTSDTTASTAGMSSLHVTWNIDDSGENCAITRQTLTWQRTDMDECPDTAGDPQETILEPEQRSISFDNMQPHSMFNVTLRIETAQGVVTVSEMKRTAERKPTGMPLGLKAKVQIGRIRFTWLRPHCGMGNGILYYDFEKIERGMSKMETKMNHTITMLQGLNEGETYSVRVRARTSAGTGPFTETMTGTYKTD